MSGFSLTERQEQARDLAAGKAKHVMLFGGSRSGKTFVHVRNLIQRAVMAPESRHAILRFRFNHLKASVIQDTWPKVLKLCPEFDGMPWKMNQTDWFAELGNGSQVWFGGLDDKDRVEKVLGQEHCTIFLNECSQISYDARNTALTRLAQRTENYNGDVMPLRMYYDCNPPSDSHWSHSLFVKHRSPDTKTPLSNPQDYVSLQMNPGHNAENLPADYIRTLEEMPGRFRRRFLDGEYSDSNPSALFAEEWIDRYRVMDGKLPDLQRIVIAVDPSGASDADNAANDEIGIAVVALGADGNGYLLEDLTLKAGPGTWGKAVVAAYDRHRADRIVAEVNYGGAMVEHVVQGAAQGRSLPFKQVTASRVKIVRAEPVAVLYEQGKCRHVGNFQLLEDELCSFTTFGYTGERSPNRADAAIWGWTELFPGIVSARKERPKPSHAPRESTRGGWMQA
jgi:hypothetical protein